ncbi:hypothetical protein PVAND_009555 [Polypedilum vanderplanki]|uniref:Acylphosphatase n=1 Tax=Polypedilum vanderplanki TaxID=319348 RepID=A0A9J6CEH1_POLVA|nr:hypothetical protein PVAND_009555 [Polypedilum vanderplanki]
MAASKIIALDFEVFGTVQGVFFRKFTEETANKFNVRGWCMNTRDGTVKGQIEGEEPKINLMKEWLSKTGSPQSTIEKTVFSEPKHLTDYTFDKFEIRRFSKK